jgi:hypothetical protein
MEERTARRSRRWAVPAVGVGVVLLFLLLAALPRGAPGPSAETAGLAQTVEGGAVAITLTPLGGARFSVVMDTHSVALDGYDLAALATLADARGNRVAPFSWEKSGASHHITGTLAFPAAGERGPLDLKGPVTVTIATVGGVDRTFRWEAGLP